MDKSMALHFIEKTIQKTKTHELQWKSSNNPEDFKYVALSSPQILSPRKNYSIIGGCCFVAEYKTGQLLLVTFAPDEVFSYPNQFNPPNDCEFSLRMQDNRQAIEIVHSSIDIEIKSQLVRLFNLIDAMLPKPYYYNCGIGLTAPSLIQDFLNS